MSRPYISAFTTNRFTLEEHIHTDSDGYGMEYATWLAEQLRAKGYSISRIEPDTSGWRMHIPQKDFELTVLSMLVPAEFAKGIEHLHLSAETFIWCTSVSAHKPFFKALFGALNTEAQEQKLGQTIATVLQMESSLRLFPEPEFDFDLDAQSSND